MQKVEDEMVEMLKAEVFERLDVSRYLGVYFLMRGDEVVYVGSSKNVVGRVSDHRGDKDFDSVSYIVVDEAMTLEAVEAAFILYFCGEYNKSLPVPYERIEDVVYLVFGGEYYHPASIIKEKTGLIVEGDWSGDFLRMNKGRGAKCSAGSGWGTTMRSSYLSKRVPKFRLNEKRLADRYTWMRSLDCFRQAILYYSTGLHENHVAQFMIEHRGCSKLYQSDYSRLASGMRHYMRDPLGWERDCMDNESFAELKLQIETINNHRKCSGFRSRAGGMETNYEPTEPVLQCSLFE